MHLELIGFSLDGQDISMRQRIDIIGINWEVACWTPPATSIQTCLPTPIPGITSPTLRELSRRGWLYLQETGLQDESCDGPLWHHLLTP